MMDNMFSGNEQKQVPKTLADCVKQDKVINNLWLWAQRLEKWRIFICIAFCIYGLFVAIVAADDVALQPYTDDADSLIQFIKVFLEYAVAAWLGIYCGFHACALLLGALAMIAQNSKITADVALLNSQQDGSIVEGPAANTASKNDFGEVLSQIPKLPYWYCSECGAKNNVNSTVCWQCGKSKQ